MGEQWICIKWRHCQIPKGLFVSVLRETQMPTTVFRAGKTNTEGKLCFARTHDQEIKTSDDKTLCPDGIYFWLPKEKK